VRPPDGDRRPSNLIRVMPAKEVERCPLAARPTVTDPRRAVRRLL